MRFRHQSRASPAADRPDPCFRSVPVPGRGRTVDARKLAPLDLGSWVEDRVLASTPLARADYGRLLAYMQRRHGPPHLAGNPGEDLSAGWRLSTPLADLVLVVRPSLATPSLGFVPMLVLEPGVDQAVTLPARRAPSVADAYRTALLDLLRPVPADGLHMNALGPVSPSDPLGERDGTGLPVHRIDPHPAAGKVIEPGMLDGAGWDALLGLVTGLGAGDAAAGLDGVVGIARNALSNAALDTSLPWIRTLAATQAARMTDAEVLTAFRLDGSQLPRLVELRHALRGGDGGLPNPGIMLDEVIEAEWLLRMMGIPSRLPDQFARLYATGRRPGCGDFDAHP